MSEHDIDADVEMADGLNDDDPIVVALTKTIGDTGDAIDIVLCFRSIGVDLRTVTLGELQAMLAAA